jgi:hypothetical protein
VLLNHAITGLKFFFEVTLDRPELMVTMHPARVPRSCPSCSAPMKCAAWSDSPSLAT